MRRLLLTILLFSLYTGVKVSAAPGNRIGSTMFYDPINECMLLFGGAQTGSGDYNRFNDLWKYDYSTDSWTEISLTTKPSGRFNTPAAYDSLNNQLIIYSGESTDSEPQMWSFSLEDYSWRRLRPSTMPFPGRCNMPLVYDEENQKIILFSGMAFDNTFPSDTWVYDPADNTWTQMPENDAPHGRYAQCLFYDSGSDSVLMFGGHWFDETGEGFSTDLWRYEYELNTWTLLEENLPLDAKWHYSYAVRGSDGACIIFGGSDGHLQYDATWIYKDGGLTQITSTSHPTARTLAAMAYDPVNDVTLLYGGLDYSGGESGELWALNNDGAWAQLAGIGAVPEEPGTTDDGIPGFPILAISIGLALIIHNITGNLTMRLKKSVYRLS